MRTLTEIFEASSKEMKTLSEIVGLELDVTDFKFVGEANCIELKTIVRGSKVIAYFKYECTDSSDMNSLNNGYYKASIEDGEIWDIVEMEGNRLIEA